MLPLGRLRIAGRGGAALALCEGQYGLANLDLVALFELLLADALVIDIGAVGAALVTDVVAPAPIAPHRGVQARDGEIFQEDVAVSAAADGHAVFTDLKRADGVIPLAHDDHAFVLRDSRARG